MKFPGGMLDQSVSTLREPLCEGFPIRHGTAVFHDGRELFAYGFLSDRVPLYFISTGNFLRMVSYSTWRHCCSSRQETVREQFPIRHDTIVFHLNRKLFANSFSFGIAPLLLITTGNLLQTEISRLRFAPLEMTVQHGKHLCHFVSTSTIFPLMHMGSEIFNMTVSCPPHMSSRAEPHAGMRIKDWRFIDTLSREISHRNTAFSIGAGDCGAPNDSKGMVPLYFMAAENIKF